MVLSRAVSMMFPHLLQLRVGEEHFELVVLGDFYAFQNGLGAWFRSSD